MKYLFWIPFGTLCGAALGIIGPVGTCMLFVAMEGERALGVGTPFAIMMILTVPGGALMGAIAGAYRAANGSWRMSRAASPGTNVRSKETVASRSDDKHRSESE